MRIAFVAFLCVSLSGCAACERHPVVCSVGASIVISSVITTVAMHEAKKSLSEQMAAAMAAANRQQ